MPSSRCKGRWSAPLLTITWAISPGPAEPPGIASGGLRATATFCSASVRPLSGSGTLRAYFLRTCTIDKQRRGPPVELLAPLRRQLDQVLRAAQGRHLGLRQVVDLFLPLDLLGNPAATVLVAILGNRRCSGWRYGTSWRPPRCARLGIEQHALPRVELLARAPVETPQQEVHVVLLPLQTRVGLLQLFEQLHDQLLQHRRVVGQQGRIGQEGIGEGKASVLMPL